MKLALQSSIQPKKITAPGPQGLPIVGNLPLLSKYKHQHQALTDLAKKYGDVFQIRIGVRPVVVLNGLETLRQALLKQQVDFAGRPNFYTLQAVFQGRAIGARDYGLLWKRHREITVNAMHIFLTRETTPIDKQVIEEAAELANIFLNYGGQPFDPEMDIGLNVANVMLRILFGERNSREDQDCIDLIKAAPGFIANVAGALIADFMPQARVFCEPGLKKFNHALNVMERLILKRVKAQWDSYDPENLQNMTHALFKAASEIDETEKQTLGLTEDLLVEASTQEMMGTALQPTFPLLRWTLLYMIAYPDVQAEVQQELDEVLGKEQQMGWEHRKKLPYTEACLFEIMRHVPCFPLTIPHATTTDTTLNGYFIPKNTPILVNLYSLTRDEHYWEEPEKFNPRRFLTESGEIREDLLDKYYPFGLGKRRCLGEHLGRLEMFIFFSNLMHRCKFEKVTGEILSFDGIPGTMLYPEKYQVIVKPRL
ncbi:MAG: cytochrome P450 [Brasilonema sp.]